LISIKSSIQTNSNTTRNLWGKNPLKIKLRKSKQKEAKRLKQEDWCPYSQEEKVPIKGMSLCRRL